MDELSALTDRLADEISEKIVERVAAKLETAASVSKPEISMLPENGDDDPDRIIGLEKLRRDYLDNLSKTSFYGGHGRPGFVDLLNVIEIGERRRGVRLSNFNEVLAQRTRSARRKRNP